MPISERHQQQKAKNYTLLAVLVALIAILFSLPFLKLQLHGAPSPADAVGTTTAPEATEKPVP